MSLKTGGNQFWGKRVSFNECKKASRLYFESLMPYAIEATILTDCAQGGGWLHTTDTHHSTDMPFEFKRLQFPLHLAFAISINKGQGQSLKVDGINLETPWFSHGALYVAFSRVGTEKNFYIFALMRKLKTLSIKQLCNENYFNALTLAYFQFSNMPRMQYRIFPGKTGSSR